MSTDPFAQLKTIQREGWALFAPLETVTTIRYIEDNQVQQHFLMTRATKR